MERTGTLRVWLAELGLDGLLQSLAPLARPMSPVAAQMLWVAQPALGAFSGDLSREAGALATLLDDPVALDHLLAELDAGVTENE